MRVNPECPEARHENERVHLAVLKIDQERTGNEDASECGPALPEAHAAEHGPKSPNFKRAPKRQCGIARQQAERAQKPCETRGVKKPVWRRAVNRSTMAG